MTSDAAVLYRCYDKTGRLIYIGSTDRWGQRLGEHSRQSWWFPLAAKIRKEKHPTLESARAAESAALRKHRPPFNWRDTGRKWLARRDDWTDSDRQLYDEFHGQFGASYDVAPPGRWSRTPRYAATA
jgi:hypothetical protein